MNIFYLKFQIPAPLLNSPPVSYPTVNYHLPKLPPGQFPPPSWWIPTWSNFLTLTLTQHLTLTLTQAGIHRESIYRGEFGRVVIHRGVTHQGGIDQGGIFWIPLKICSKFTGEHPCRSVVSIKSQSNFIEITLQHGCSPVNLLHIFRTLFPKNTSGWLLLLLEEAHLAY